MEKQHKDIAFSLFVFVTLVLSVLYFSVPERVQFMENQFNWWAELLSIILQ
jgi:hypothetical protein